MLPPLLLKIPASFEIDPKIRPAWFMQFVNEKNTILIILIFCKGKTYILEPLQKLINRKNPERSGDAPRRERSGPKSLLKIEKQVDRSSEESLAALNKEAAWGGKKKSSGNTHYWKGGKLHLDVTDNGLPVTAL